MPRLFRFLVVITLALSFRAEASFFGIPDSDTAIALQTYWENFWQNAKLATIIEHAREGTTIALDSYRAMAASVRTVKNVAHIVRNPENFLEKELMAFDKAFPDVKGIAQDLVAMRETILSLGKDGGYDPYALQEALYYARKAGVDTFALKSRLEDKDDVSSPHDSLNEKFKKQKSQVDEIFDDIERRLGLTGITPQEAMIFQARASAQQARAAVATALLLNESTRIAKLQLNASMDKKAAREQRLNRELQNLRDLVPKDLSLNPWKTGGKIDR